ncbi:hypothetical protein ASPWEDRAFT_173493 [Aspergillus wentii DTO 134E9]|uniref:Uncharacterized protein n=1 Tax=Aspergillus wentii DTO 134E9 TaxID=1073089 RepID=A0A1L9RGI5_ASPWE|nr:uncharacterized protein ASPWEDRAFT_173493 [Aspergillus wentii DTO 134E9]KAI9927843.1 hypothetical protein MW887_002695 [Aspergillus wentii]OJJ34059.1 hypothetical protein ASPWEDRAFT_173493 [Aspergillus wentii DTO 134E9]
MQPNHYDLLGQARDEPRSAGRMTRDAHQPPRERPLQSRSSSGVAPTRSEDSWIEVSSQPSSSSVSSTSNDDIITTGLRVESSSYQQRNRRRRLQRLTASTTAQVDYSSRDTSSSQDEYEESESESDRVLSSSNEEMTRQPLRGPLLSQTPPISDAASSDEDDSSTALGMRISSSPFVPQPNVFSHPPVSQDPSWTRATETPRSEPSVVSNSSRQTAIRRNSQASIRSTRRQQPNQQHSPYNMISPSHHADHDAALRASLSTLLSCAAAARGLPKQETRPSPAGPSRGQPPSSFRLVSESVAMGEESGEESPSAAEANAPTEPQRSRKHPQPAYPPHMAPSSKTKRRSSPSKDRSAASKKGRRVSMSDSAAAASPTIMTWVISAGVVVIFSAISFSAGYMLGREVGRTEMGTGMGMVGNGAGGISDGRASAACGQEAVKGSLKRLRWGSAASASGIIA